MFVAKIWRLVLFVAAAALAFGSVSAQIIPAERKVDWTPGVTVGVPGGIPTDRTKLVDVTKAPYDADKSGATDAQPAIQAAIDAAQIGDVVYLPAGKIQGERGESISTTRTISRYEGTETPQFLILAYPTVRLYTSVVDLITCGIPRTPQSSVVFRGALVR